MGLLGIMDEDALCMILAVTNGKKKFVAILALQLNKGLKKGDATYIAILVEEEQSSGMEEIPAEEIE